MMMMGGGGEEEVTPPLKLQRSNSKRVRGGTSRPARKGRWWSCSTPPDRFLETQGAEGEGEILAGGAGGDGGAAVGEEGRTKKSGRSSGIFSRFIVSG